MGMFDIIQCSDAMPFNDDMAALGLNVRDWSFQTKDLNDLMSEYVLQDGILYERKYKETKWIEPDPLNKDKWHFGHMDYTDGYLEDTKYHGVINMYDYRQDVMGWDCYIEYAVTFTGGVVTNTELTKFTKEDSAPRIQQHNEVWDRLEAAAAKWYNKYIFYTPRYRFIRKYLAKFLCTLGNYLLRLSFKLP